MMGRSSRTIILPIILLVSPFQIIYPRLHVSSDHKSGFSQNNVTPEGPILDLTVTCQGMCPKKPEVLIRLYKDCRAEWTEYNYEKWEQVQRTVRLSTEEVQKLIRLARSRGFLESERKYEALRDYDDSFYTWVLSYEQDAYHKTVVLDNYDSKAPKASEYYPRDLIELIESIRQLRREYLKKR